MFYFLIPLLLGFTFNAASAFTTLYSSWFGVSGGRLASIILRDVLGIPVWLIGYAMAVRESSTLLFSPSIFTSLLAWAFILAGAMIIIAGIISIRGRAVAPSMKDSLVIHGIYAYIRHPLYSGMILELLGLFLWIPTVTVFVACLSGWLWVMVQARLEEMDLVQRLPAYKETMQQVPRFVPKVRF